MTEIRLPYRVETLDGLFAVAQHASKNDVTSIIQTVQVTTREFIATDRYTVGVWEHTTLAESTERYGDDGPDDATAEILIPRATAEWLSKQLPKTLGHSQGSAELILEIVLTEDSVSIVEVRETMTIVAATQLFTRVGGNFPPVRRLFPGDDAKQYDGAGVIALGPEHLSKFIKSILRAGGKHEALRFALTHTDSGKPGPVVVEFGTRFHGLMQPNLLLR